MLTNRPPIGIVWLKRDLRLHDHAALHVALKENKRVLLVYVFETVLAQDPHYSSRHFDFIKQSLIDMNRQLVQFNTKIRFRSFCSPSSFPAMARPLQLKGADRAGQGGLEI